MSPQNHVALISCIKVDPFRGLGHDGLRIQFKSFFPIFAFKGIYEGAKLAKKAISAIFPFLEMFQMACKLEKCFWLDIQHIMTTREFYLVEKKSWNLK